MPRMFARSVKCQYPSIRSLLKLFPVGAISLVGMVLLSAGPLVCGQERSEKPENKQHADSAPVDTLRDAAIKSDETQVQELKQRADELREKQRELRHAVQKTCGLSPENVAPILLGLERDRFNLEIEAKLKTARRESIARIVAEQSKHAHDRTGTDEIVAQLKRLVAARQDALKYRQEAHNVAAGSQGDVNNAEAELAEAEIRLAMRKEELGKSHEDGDEVTDRLNRQLLDVSVELTQDELRLQLLATKLDALGAAQNLLDDYKYTSESELPRVLRLLDQAETQLAGLKYPN